MKAICVVFSLNLVFLFCCPAIDFCGSVLWLMLLYVLHFELFKAQQHFIQQSTFGETLMFGMSFLCRMPTTFFVPSVMCWLIVKFLLPLFFDVRVFITIHPSISKPPSLSICVLPAFLLICGFLFVARFVCLLVVVGSGLLNNLVQSPFFNVVEPSCALFGHA